jgi:N,N'-diacetyllegionaminate synthase
MKIFAPGSLIAEIAGNFSTVEEAVQLSIGAVSNGAESVKLQTYHPDTLTSRQAVFNMPNTGLREQYDVFRESMIDQGMQREIIDELKIRGIEIFSTPSHPTDIEFLETCGVNRYKIGSDDCMNFELIEAAGSTGKPVIVSTGMATINEVELTVEFCTRKNYEFALMHCTTNYPCQLEELNLRTIKTYIDCFKNIEIGFSDHYPGYISSIIAASLGATFFEKHIMPNSESGGYDAVVSMKVDEIGPFILNLKSVEAALGSPLKSMSKAELINRTNNRKSLFACRTIVSGEMVTNDALISLRPGTGIGPNLRCDIVGRRATRTLIAGEMIRWEDLA